MRKIVFFILAALILLAFNNQDAADILKKVDENLSSENRIFKSTIIVHGRRGSRTITLRSWSVGDSKSFTEYLSPAREQGTRMLKLKDQLWIYSPATDRIIQISGHMLRQSVMGSDLSYEDMMEDRKMTEMYNATLVGEETLDGRTVMVLDLVAKVEDVGYHSQKLWIDAERFIPLKQELFAKSGQLLKRMEMKEIERVDGRWFPTTIIYKDMLKQGDGTEFKVSDIRFNQEIPEHIFSKAVLNNRSLDE
jgi:outer membrane lipoprotein-sorting protein